MDFNVRWKPFTLISIRRTFANGNLTSSGENLLHFASPLVCHTISWSKFHHLLKFNHFYFVNLRVCCKQFWKWFPFIRRSFKNVRHVFDQKKKTNNLKFSAIFISNKFSRSNGDFRRLRAHQRMKNAWTGDDKPKLTDEVWLTL